MCRAHRQATNNQGQQGQGNPQICIYCGSIEHSASNCHRRPWDNREQPCSTPEFLRKNQQANPANSGNATGRAATTSTNTEHNGISSQYYRNYNYRESQRQPHARFNERYHQRYSLPAFPSTPSLNSSFREVLSKSLLQIAEN